MSLGFETRSSRLTQRLPQLGALNDTAILATHRTYGLKGLNSQYVPSRNGIKPPLR